MKEKGKFILGMVLGIVCTVLIFTGVYAATAATNKKTPDKQVEDGRDQEEREESEAGNLISQNGQSVGGVRTSDLIDTKANYIMRIIDNYFLNDVT